ncbi:hypothetical protein ACEQ8H_008696 [Pleosporales sp. CAS-2024a]
MASTSDTFTAIKGDVEAVGAHCQMEYCHVLDFLPFRCESCKGTYCLDHRSEHAHKCPQEGLWARQRAAQQQSSAASSAPKPSLYTHDQQCFASACKTLINTSRMPASQCTTCNRSYCLKHRMPEDHDCAHVPRGGAASTLDNTRLSALAKLKLWAESKRREDDQRRAPKKSGGLFGLGGGTRTSASSLAAAELNALKRAAKGDATIPAEKRIYLHVEASADTTKAKYPTGKFYYNHEWSVGRVLDTAAKALQVQNVNNHGGGEEERLRVFHVEGGRLLRFSEKIGEAVASGNMIVLLRGVGSGEVDLIDLS